MKLRRNFSFFFMFLVIIFLDSCSSFKTASHNPNDPKIPTDAPVLEEEEEVTEQTPTDVGDVEASDKVTTDEQKADELSSKTFPLVYNEYVNQWIKYFSGSGRKSYRIYLERSTAFIGHMKQVLKEEGLPEELIYLSMIESGFSTKATSRVGAKGQWQFMPFTGKRFGLASDFWLDERRDFIKATRAACIYLKELHDVFGSWYLAAAAYNAGEAKVLGAIRDNKTRNFWELIRNKKAFKKETRQYVPKLIAAALMAKNPEHYGFTDVAYQKPLQWVMVDVPGKIDLMSVAKISGENIEMLKDLNPELRMSITPADRQSYPLRISPDKAPALASNISKLEKGEVSAFAYHKVRSGDTLSSIARAYGSNMRTILELNQIKNARSLRVGSKLAVPLREPKVYSASRKSEEKSTRQSRRKNQETAKSESAPAPVAAAPVVAVPAPAKEAPAVTAAAPANEQKTAPAVSTVAPAVPTASPATPATTAVEAKSDKASAPPAAAATPAPVATTPVDSAPATTAISSANTTLPSNAVSPADKIAPGIETADTYTVQSGDTLWGISQRFGISVQKLKKINNIRSAKGIQPGKVLKVSKKAEQSFLHKNIKLAKRVAGSSKYKTYRVKRGDTLWSISERNGISLVQLRKINGLKAGENLQAGRKIKISLAAN